MITSDIQKLEPGELVQLFELDASEIGGDVLRFHGYAQGAIWWQGNEYAPWAIEATGFAKSGDAQQPAPQLRVGNIGQDADGNPVPGVITALCHGAFFGIGSVVAANLVPANKRASAVALMFTGLTLANVLGVPLGTALGQQAGWRSTFWAVTVIGVIALIGLIRFLPAKRDEEKLDMRAELAALKGAGIWLSLSMTALFAASMFTLFTYVAPLLGDVTGVSPKGVTWTLLLIGLGLTVGNIIGGKLADKRLAATLIGVFISMAVVSTALSWTSVAVIPTEITLFLWATAAFAAVPALQINVVTFGKAAPNLVSTLNIGAFNIGNALGAWVGGSVIAHGFGLTSVPLAAAALAILALLVTLITFRQSGDADLAPATN